LFAATLSGYLTYVTQRYSISADVNADNQGKDKQTSVRDYFPLEIGSKWTYTLETYGEKREDNIFIVTGKEKFDGVECIKVEQSQEKNGKLEPLSISCYTKDEKGVYLHRYGQIGEKEIKWTYVYNPPLQILSYPLKKLKTWEWKGKSYVNQDQTFQDQTFSFKVIGEKEVETPAGKFKTYVVQRDLDMASPFWEIYYYSPEVGLVAHQILNRSIFKLKGFAKPEGSKRDGKN